jgi:hypothetical protein
MHNKTVATRRFVPIGIFRITAKRGWRIWAQPKMAEKQNKKLKNNK